MSDSILVPVIHAITDDLIATRNGFLARAAAVMRVLGTRGAVHLRTRLLPTTTLYELSRQLADAQEETGCWLVLSDRVDVALAAEARGVQLTSRSMTVVDARAMAPDLAIGASVHAAHEARTAEQAGANWVVAGHILPTASHGGEPARGVAFIRSIREATILPCIAIGGVRPSHVVPLREAGAHGVAAIRGIWGEAGDAGDAERAASDYLSAYEADSGSAL